jgi:hypothetical protein
LGQVVLEEERVAFAMKLEAPQEWVKEAEGRIHHCHFGWLRSMWILWLRRS